MAKRTEILKNFYVLVDGIKQFQAIDGVFEHLKMNDMLLTTHENPERKGTFFRLYHFIINANLSERQESAVQARK